MCHGWSAGSYVARRPNRLIERTYGREDLGRWRSLLSLTPAGQRVFGRRAEEVDGRVVPVFDAKLVGGLGTPVREVGALVAVGSQEYRTALHDAIR